MCQKSPSIILLVYRPHRNIQKFWCSKLYHSTNGTCGGFAPRPPPAPKMSIKKRRSPVFNFLLMHFIWKQIKNKKFSLFFICFHIKTPPKMVYSRRRCRHHLRRISFVLLIAPGVFVLFPLRFLRPFLLLRNRQKSLEFLRPLILFV